MLRMARWSLMTMQLFPDLRSMKVFRRQPRRMIWIIMHSKIAHLMREFRDESAVCSQMVAHYVMGMLS